MNIASVREILEEEDEWANEPTTKCERYEPNQGFVRHDNGQGHYVNINISEGDDE